MKDSRRFDYASVRGWILPAVCILALLCALFARNAIPSRASAFVGSIEQKGAPDVDKIVDSTGRDVDNEIIVTPYVDRHSMPPDKVEDFEESYQAVNVVEISEIINQGVKDHSILLPKRWGSGSGTLDPEDITVTDIFYVHKKNDLTDPKLPVTITMKSPVSPNRLLLVFYYDGKKWILVPSTREGDKISFMAYKYGSYMFVSNTVLEKAGDGNIPSSPQTGYDEW